MSKTFFMKENAINQSGCRSYILGGISRPIEAKIPTNLQSYATYILMLRFFLSLSKEAKREAEELTAQSRAGLAGSKGGGGVTGNGWEKKGKKQ